MLNAGQNVEKKRGGGRKRLIKTTKRIKYVNTLRKDIYQKRRLTPTRNSRHIRQRKGGHLRIDTDYLFPPPSPQSHVIIVPDCHGDVSCLDYINVLLETYSERFSWIALEYVLHGFGDHLKIFLDKIQSPITDITDELCNTFCTCFIYGKRRNTEPCSKIYAPNIKYARRLLEILKKFEKIICLEMARRPLHEEPLWASYLPQDGSGIVLVGAEHVLPLSKEIRKQSNYKYNTYTIFRHYEQPVYYFIKPTTYKSKSGEVAPFTY